MNYQKIKEQVYNAGYCDERKLICHSNRSCTKSSNYLVTMKFTTYQTDFRVPAFFILSIKDDKLFISYAKAFGGFKKNYATMPLSKLHYVSCELVNKSTMVYHFTINGESTNKNNFYIIATKNKADAQLLVDAIKEYNNEN